MLGVEISYCMLTPAHMHSSPRTDCSPPGARRWQSTGGKAGGSTDICQGYPPLCAPGLKGMQIAWPWLHSTGQGSGETVNVPALGPLTRTRMLWSSFQISTMVQVAEK